MRIVHFTKNDSGGGAFTACERVHREMLKRNSESYILCERSSGNVPNSIGIRSSLRWQLFNRLRNRFLFEFSKLLKPPFFFEPDCHPFYSINYFGNNILKVVENIKPDIVHLHWVGGGFLRIEDLRILSHKYPVVWTFHDMWPFCGAEHYTMNETRWVNGYRADNRSGLSKGVDINRWTWNRKVESWNSIRINTISVSMWLGEQVLRSKLFRNISGRRTVIPNGLDPDRFIPGPRLRNHSPTSAERPWKILFGAVDLNQWIKGGDLFIEAIRILIKTGKKIELSTFGGGQKLALDSVLVKNYGRINSIERLAEIYAEADVMVVPSRMEAFGQVAIEAMACSTPVVCFDTTGLRDIVRHKENGYRAVCFDPNDLARGIEWCLSSSTFKREFGSSVRESGLQRFTISSVVTSTLSFYEEVLNQPE